MNLPNCFGLVLGTFEAKNRKCSSGAKFLKSEKDMAAGRGPYLVKWSIKWEEGQAQECPKICPHGLCRPQRRHLLVFFFRTRTADS